MKKITKIIFQYLVIFVTVVTLLLTILLATMKIPKSAIEDNKQANTQYLRYWHGSMAILRPCLMLFYI